MERIFLSPPEISEIERDGLLAALSTGYVAPVGPSITEFENAVAARLGGGVHCVALSSGTAALHLGLILLGIQRGDIVIVPSFTFVATVNPVCYMGAIPWFVDCEDQSWNLSPTGVREAIKECLRQGKRPKAIITADVYGQSSDYKSLLEISQEFEIPMLQDSSEGLGASWAGEPLGLQGDIAVFSFNGNKIVTTGGGGMLVTRNGDWARRARSLASQARDPKDSSSHLEVGYNYRMGNLPAGYGLAQLTRLDAFIEMRRAHFQVYSAMLSTLPFVRMMPFGAFGSPNYWLTCITIEGASSSDVRDGLLAALEKKLIEARPLWKPLHLQIPFQDYPRGECQLSERLGASGICLPSGSSMSHQARASVIDVILGYYTS